MKIEIQNGGYKQKASGEGFDTVELKGEHSLFDEKWQLYDVGMIKMDGKEFVFPFDEAKFTDLRSITAKEVMNRGTNNERYCGGGVKRDVELRVDIGPWTKKGQDINFNNFIKYCRDRGLKDEYSYEKQGMGFTQTYRVKLTGKPLEDAVIDIDNR
mgnify:FL=1